jgi:diguanylate cyclase (GGDEF)-like protein
MMIDIDSFKNYNDTYGHSAGDICLKIVAEVLSTSITRADDFVARYGGEEFIVVMPNTSKAGALVIAERMIKGICDCNIFHEKESGENCITISIGITTSIVQREHTVEQFIIKADDMLYQSKKNGRNRYTFGKL